MWGRGDGTLAYRCHDDADIIEAQFLGEVETAVDATSTAAEGPVEFQSHKVSQLKSTGARGGERVKMRFKSRTTSVSTQRVSGYIEAKSHAGRGLSYRRKTITALGKGEWGVTNRAMVVASARGRHR